VFVYCTPAAEAHAKILRCVLEASGDRTVVIAPMTCDSLLAALEGTRAGDAVVFAGDELQAALDSRGLVRGEPIAFPLAVCAVGLAPFDLAALATPGKRLGGCSPDRPLGAAVRAALPEDLRSGIEANLTHRSERGDELVRLLRLGALDAAFLWATPPPPAVLHVVRLPEAGRAACITITGLSCSRLTDLEWSQVIAVWRSETTQRALDGEPVPTARTDP
jgi:hypothetical protein